MLALPARVFARGRQFCEDRAEEADVELKRVTLPWMLPVGDQIHLTCVRPASFRGSRSSSTWAG